MNDASAAATKFGCGSPLNHHSKGFCRANHAAVTTTATGAMSSALPHQRAPRAAVNASAIVVIASTTVIGDPSRFIACATAIPNGVCDPNGCCSSSGAAATAAATTASTTD